MTSKVANWSVQLRKGAADFAILSLVGKSPRSGVQLFKALSHFPGIGIAEGSMYPLLNRLQRDGLISGTWHASTTGTRNQKVYTLTAAGRDHFLEMRKVWIGFFNEMNTLLEEDG